MTDKQRADILSDFVIRLHTATWTGNDKHFAELMKRAAAYSYTRTNSIEGQSDEEYAESCEKTLKALTER